MPCSLTGNRLAFQKLKTRWKEFLTKLPKLVNSVDDCLSDGTQLTGELKVLLRPKSKGFGVSRDPEVTVTEVVTQPQMTYPLCNEQSVRAGVEAVATQMDGLGRDKKLLQDQVRLVQGRVAQTDEITR